MSGQDNTPVERVVLGSKQAIKCLILPWQYGQTEEQKAATIAALGKEEIFTRNDLRACVQETSEKLMADARAAGKKALELQDYEKALAEFQATAEAMAASRNKTVADVIVGLIAMDCGPPKPPEEEPAPEPYVVTITFSGEPNDPGSEYEAYCSVGSPGHSTGGVGNMSDCPEDANLGRDSGWVYDLPDWLKAAHQAGADGRPFELVEKPNQD